MNKRGIAFISIVVASVIIVGVVGFFFDESSVMFSPNQDSLGVGDTQEEWTRLFLFRVGVEGEYQRYFALIVLRDTTYKVEFITGSDNAATIKVRNLVSGESSQKEINEGATKQLLNLKIKVIEADEDQRNNILSATIEVTGVEVDYECVAPPEGLVSWWDGGGSLGVAGDVWDGNDGVVYGVLNGPGVVGEGFKFDGEDDYIEISDADNLDVTSITIDAWVKGQNEESYKTIISKGRRLGSGWDIDIDRHGELTCYFTTERAQAIQTTREKPEFNLLYDTWTHIACTYDKISGEANVYINGMLANSPGYERGGHGENESLEINNESLLIGSAIDFDNEGYFKGLLDEVQIFNRALSEEEVRSIFLAGVFGKCREGEGPTHAVCAGEQCVVAEGEGTNECFDSYDCETHLECRDATCTIVPGPGPDQCPRVNDPCIPEEFHFACLNGACQMVPGPGPDTCDQDTICPEFGNIGDGEI